MGKAVILANIGEGLYKARPLLDWRELDAEVAALEAAQATYSADLMRAYRTRDGLIEDRNIAEAAMSAVIQQWKAGLISKLQDSPPPIPPPQPNDPITGEPWTDPARAQEEPLLTLINQYRSAQGKPTLSRDSKLNQAALNHLRWQGSSQRMGHTGAAGSDVGVRAHWADYAWLTVDETLTYGQGSPGDALSSWQSSTEARAQLLGAYTDCGIAYHYATQHPATHLWCVVLGTPSPLPLPGTLEEPKKDPAKEAAKTTEAELEKIEVPRLDKLQPSKLGEVVQKYAIAAQKLIAAERELTRLQAEKIERDRRLAALRAFKAPYETISYDVWCCHYTDNLAPGQQVETFEVPGFWRDAGVTKTATLKKGTPQAYTVSYVERSWNIAPSGTGYPPHGQLRPAITMSAAHLLHTIAFEPASLKWRPVCRYGTITAINPSEGNLCTVALTPVNARLLRGEYPAQPLSLIEVGQETLTNVPISYAPCYQWAFEVGDEVLVVFANFDRTRPKVIGFRRQPVNCQGRVSWSQQGF
jgi:uncharacterized protein YkwD